MKQLKTPQNPPISPRRRSLNRPAGRIAGRRIRPVRREAIVLSLLVLGGAALAFGAREPASLALLASAGKVLWDAKSAAVELVLTVIAARLPRRK